MMVFDWIGKWAEYSPDKVAIRDVKTGEDHSYSDLNKLAETIAANLHEKFELVKGDRIAILSAFNAEFIALFSAAQKAGFILVPINTHLTAHEVAYQISNSDSKLIIYQDEYSEKLNESEVSRIKWDKTSAPSAITYTEELSENDPIFILYTSGTTGRPKGCIYTHKMLFWNSINTQLRLDINSNDITLNCMPSFHTGGWNVLITPFLHHGATVWLLSDFDPDVVLENLEKSKSTLFMAVPTMLKIMSDSKAFAEADLSKIRYFIVGGEALPIPEIETWEKKGILIRQGFGLTEVGPNVTSLHQSDTTRKRGSIGFFNFYISGKVINKAGKECKPDEVGELILGGPNVSPGYWNNPIATTDSYKDGFFRTGDLVKRDADGYIYVVGRKKEMYISGGENVYPREVEKVLQEHPDIAEAAVVGVPHEKWGETGAAFLIKKPGSHVTKDEILTYCKEYLAKFKLPKHIVFLDSFPKNATGKIDKKELKSKLNQTTKTSNYENK